MRRTRETDKSAGDDPPDSIEDLIGDLMSGLGDKVRTTYLHNSADRTGHDSPLFCCQVSGENYSKPPRRLPGADRQRYSSSIWRHRRRTSDRKLFQHYRRSGRKRIGRYHGLRRGRVASWGCQVARGLPCSCGAGEARPSPGRSTWRDGHLGSEGKFRSDQSSTR